jgi:hypothetical protein
MRELACTHEQSTLQRTHVIARVEYPNNTTPMKAIFAILVLGIATLVLGLPKNPNIVMLFAGIFSVSPLFDHHSPH